MNTQGGMRLDYEKTQRIAEALTLSPIDRDADARAFTFFVVGDGDAYDITDAILVIIDRLNDLEKQVKRLQGFPA